MLGRPLRRLQVTNKFNDINDYSEDVEHFSSIMDDVVPAELRAMGVGSLKALSRHKMPMEQSVRRYCTLKLFRYFLGMVCGP